MIDWDAPSEEVAVKRPNGRVWHRLRAARACGGVDGIPDLRSWIACGVRIRRADEVTQWGRPVENVCRRCWR